MGRKSNSASDRPRPLDDSGEFVRRSEEILLATSVDLERMSWVYETNITDDTEFLSAKMQASAIAIKRQIAKDSRRYARRTHSRELRRKLELLRLTSSLMAPVDPKENAELTRRLTSMRSAYGKGKYRMRGEKAVSDLNGLARILARSRDPRRLQEAWVGWHATARPMRPDFERYIALANKGARELEFSDTGEMWRSGYDMEPAAFEREVRRLWEQVRPLYELLHAYVRARLREHYGAVLVPPREPIPAHLLGNMWAQLWSNVFPLVAPEKLRQGVDLTNALKRRGIDARGIVRIGERFFVSLGFDALPTTFWERSQFTKPRDREVMCHPSAWDVDYDEDLRLKMCIEITGEDFQVVHHELGHNFYQREYRKLPFLYRDGANDGFHEAVGDAVALSVTPAYLKRIDLIDSVPPASAELGAMLRLALDKVAILPFSFLIDRWRWDVFSGKIAPEEYNDSWWRLREQFQGVRPPVDRTPEDFDPGAKMHVSGNVPYVRYFLAAILQFQFHQALARAAGADGPLHRFSVYGNKTAGRRLIKMFRMGASRPWPEALETLTGSRRMDAGALLDYFSPLHDWLQQHTKATPVGW
ncbi:MAG: M2 family metallopeptidase [Thermoplasmata archaeon]